MHIINPMRHALSIALLISLVASNAHATVFTVNTTSDSVANPGSLRYAITNLAAGANTIQFDISTSDPGYNPTMQTWTIQPATDLPNIVQQVTISGYTFAGAVYNTATPNTLAQGDNAVLQIIINGSNYTVGDGAITGNGLHFAAGSDGSLVSGLVINEWVDNGILIDGTDGTINGIQINGNFIGTNAAGTAVDANRCGIAISGTTNAITNTIIGTEALADRNIIAGSFQYFNPDSYGVRGACISTISSSGTTIQNNYIGTDINGQIALGNSTAGIIFNGETGSLIGGTTSQSNLISGHAIYGVNLSGNFLFNSFVGVTGSTFCAVQENKIGTNIQGNTGLGNSNAGVEVESFSTNNTIINNLISGNGAGIHLGQASMPGNNFNMVQGNSIGTDFSGTNIIANTRFGIEVNDSENTVGGAVLGQGNAISGNVQGGILIYATSDTTVNGNLIGTDKTGTKKLGNNGPGIQIGLNGGLGGSSANTIGS